KCIKLCPWLRLFRQLRPQPTGRAKCHFAKPATHRLTLVDRPSMANEHQKGCLEGILGLMLVVENSPAQIEDHRSVPPTSISNAQSARSRIKASISGHRK